jgi:hypothetical protein
MKRVKSPIVCLTILILSGLLQGCGISKAGEASEPRASFDPDAFENSEDARAKKLAPMIDSFAQHMWLSTVKDEGNTEK